mmetsp:Transcript_8257/g.10812  ORF Transcript_8257/g.10812 Transcript_8257/m.10812 type:complete len:387 (-) Transcript_8257:274-1434(-)
MEALSRDNRDNSCKPLALFIWLFLCAGVSIVESKVIVSRASFLFQSSAFSLLSNNAAQQLNDISPVTLLPLAGDHKKSNREAAREISWKIPLQFLPRAGCLAVPVTLRDDHKNDFMRYLAVVDTGSPFLTAPPSQSIFAITKPSKKYPNTSEQYGSTVGEEIQWRISKRVQVGYNGNLLSKTNLVLAVAPRELVDATGGIFMGLIAKDDHRPALLEQFGVRSFRLDYQQRVLHLSTKALLAGTSGISVDMFDLSQYGSNLYHYAVDCKELVMFTNKGKIKMVPADLSRKVVVVVDTGLSGCILSDSWLQDDALPCDIEDVVGMDLGLGPIALRSQDSYWYLDCFRLPWFEDDTNHPHIIAAGATFLQDAIITVDSQEKRMALEFAP